MSQYWQIHIHKKYVYDSPESYGDDLIIPIEKLRKLANEFPDSANLEFLFEYAEIARQAIIERGWQNTPIEWTHGDFDGLWLASKYLKRKHCFTPEEQKEVAAALRDVGRNAHFKRTQLIHYGGIDGKFTSRSSIK